LPYAFIPDCDLPRVSQFGTFFQQLADNSNYFGSISETQIPSEDYREARMVDQRTVVVTGFGNWARTAPNPATLALRELSAQTWRHCRFVPIEVPVKTTGLFEIVEDALLTYRPAIWLGLGVAPEATVIRLEVAGINCRDFDVPDNDDLKLDGAPVVEGGDDAYFSTLPVRDLVSAIQDAEIPVSISYSAGTHLCNQMLYTSLHLTRRHGLDTKCGFMHVPYTPDLASKLAETEGPQPSMALPLMTEAARIAIERSLQHMESEQNLAPKVQGNARDVG
jgi:pyroglutamyl-peptidase